MSTTAEVLSSTANPWADATGHRPKNQKKQALELLFRRQVSTLSVTMRTLKKAECLPPSP